MPKAMQESMSFRLQDMSERKVLHFHFGNKKWVGSKIHTKTSLI